MGMNNFDLDDASAWGTMSQGMRLALTEAAQVVLDRFHREVNQLAMHPRHTALGIWSKADNEWVDIAIVWTASTPDMTTTYANLKDATEDGAYAIAVHAMSHFGWRVMGRAQQGSGADWIVRDPTRPECVIKLEVSGIAEGGSPGNRLSMKTTQAKGGTPSDAGVALVFRFSDAQLLSRVW
jgi:hypothetical protein